MRSIRKYTPKTSEINVGYRIYDLKDYLDQGLLGDVAINAAIQDAKADGGGLVLIPTSQDIHSSIILPSKVILEGIGKGVVLKKMGNFPAIITEDYATLSSTSSYAAPRKFGIYNLTIDGNQFSGGGVQIYGKKFYIDHLHVKNDLGIGFQSRWRGDGSVYTDATSPTGEDGSDGMESICGEIRCSNNLGGNFLWQGPGDSRIESLITTFASGSPGTAPFDIRLEKGSYISGSSGPRTFSGSSTHFGHIHSYGSSIVSGNARFYSDVGFQCDYLQVESSGTNCDAIFLDSGADSSQINKLRCYGSSRNAVTIAAQSVKIDNAYITDSTMSPLVMGVSSNPASNCIINIISSTYPINISNIGTGNKISGFVDAQESAIFNDNQSGAIGQNDFSDLIFNGETGYKDAAPTGVNITLSPNRKASGTIDSEGQAVQSSSITLETAGLYEKTIGQQTVGSVLSKESIVLDSFPHNPYTLPYVTLRTSVETENFGIRFKVGNTLFAGGTKQSLQILDFSTNNPISLSTYNKYFHPGGILKINSAGLTSELVTIKDLDKVNGRIYIHPTYSHSIGESIDITNMTLSFLSGDGTTELAGNGAIFGASDMLMKDGQGIFSWTNNTPLKFGTRASVLQNGIGSTYILAPEFWEGQYFGQSPITARLLLNQPALDSRDIATISTNKSILKTEGRRSDTIYRASDFTLTTLNEIAIVNAPSADVVVTLPAVEDTSLPSTVLKNGQIYTIKRDVGSAFNIIIQAPPGANIDGSTSFTLSTPLQSVRLVGLEGTLSGINGVRNWRII